MGKENEPKETHPAGEKDFLFILLVSLKMINSGFALKHIIFQHSTHCINYENFFNAGEILKNKNFIFKMKKLSCQGFWQDFLFEKENNKDYNVMEVLNFWRRYEKNRRF